MGLFLFRFWPVLIPLLVYWLWLARARGKARKAGEALPHFRDGPWFLAVIASLLTALLIFLALGLSAEQSGSEYVPPHMENGELVPGKIAP